MRNIDKYREELEQLYDEGVDLHFSLMNTIEPEHCEQEVFQCTRKSYEEIEIYILNLPDFFVYYQPWYTEALVLLKQILPDRVNDFKSHYEKPKNRKAITHESYRIEDALQLVRRSNVGLPSALPHLKQQIAILRAAKRRFTSSLFDIQKLVQADLFDNELDAAKSLNKNKFFRAAGAIAGVVLENHLKEVCKEKEIKLSTKNPTISVLSEALKDKEIIDIPTWRHISLLGDIRNECSHSKDVEPTKDRVDDLIQGVDKIIKTVF